MPEWFDKFVWNEFEHRVTMAPKGWNSWMSGIAGQTRQIVRMDDLQIAEQYPKGELQGCNE